MTCYSSAELCKLTVQEVADLLLDGIVDGKDQCSCKVVGECDGRLFELELVMREVESC